MKARILKVEIQLVCPHCEKLTYFTSNGNDYSISHYPNVHMNICECCHKDIYWSVKAQGNFELSCCSS